MTIPESLNMPKYYIKSGSLELIYSTDKGPMDAAADALWETNEHDTLDEYFYVDERGLKDYKTALPDTIVVSTQMIMHKAGWSIE